MPRHLESISNGQGQVHRGGIGILRAADEAANVWGKGEGGGGVGRGGQERKGHQDELSGLLGPSPSAAREEQGGRLSFLEKPALRGGAREETDADRYMSIMQIYDMMGVQPPNDEDFNSGIPPREEGDAQGAAAHMWR